MNEFAVTTLKANDLPRPLAKRSAIDPFIVMDVMGEANACELAGHDIIHMEVGQPATPAPRAARERSQEALEKERLGYTEALGLPQLRERIAAFRIAMAWASGQAGCGYPPAPRQDSCLHSSLYSIKATDLACRRLAIPATARSSRLWMFAQL